MKKILALFLCLIMILASFAGCGGNNGENAVDGAHIKMYLSDPVYNFDPAEAYKNESALKIASLLFDNLFILNKDGNVEKSLVKNYSFDKTKKTMSIELRTDTFWSDGNAINANDVVFAWQRILAPENSFEAASLLFDIKNARAAKEGEVTIDDVGISALNNTDILITFEDKNIDYDNFLIKLTSYALAPLRENVVSRVEVANDWAKSTSLLVTSGPFRVRSVSYNPETAGITLERNAYYRRDFMNDAPDKSVKPFRLIIDYTKSADQILADYENGEIFFIGDIPLSARSKYTLEEWKKNATIADSLSTHSYILNENAEINGEKLFANPAVRTALSLAIDRNAIAAAIVFAEPATGLVPTGVFNANKKNKTFRDASNNNIATGANKDAADAKLKEAKITPSKYSFKISVPEYDDVHVKIAEIVAESWSALGFKVSVNKIKTVDNQDKALSTGEKIAGVKDDIFIEKLAAGDFEVAAFDYVAYSADAFSVLAPFAFGYSGSATSHTQSPEFTVKPHISGYNSADYNAKIEAAYLESDPEKRAAILHEAESILLADMPIIPIIFNQSATMKSKDLSEVNFTYYQVPVFNKTNLKDFEKYIPAEE